MDLRVADSIKGILSNNRFCIREYIFEYIIRKSTIEGRWNHILCATKMARILNNKKRIKALDKDDRIFIAKSIADLLKQIINYNGTLKFSYNKYKYVITTGYLSFIAEALYDTKFVGAWIFNYFCDVVSCIKGTVFNKGYLVMNAINQNSVNPKHLLWLADSEYFWSRLANITDVYKDMCDYGQEPEWEMVLSKDYIPLKKYWDLIIDKRAQALLKFIAIYGCLTHEKAYSWHVNSPDLMRKIFTDLGIDYDRYVHVFMLKYLTKHIYEHEQITYMGFSRLINNTGFEFKVSDYFGDELNGLY